MRRSFLSLTTFAFVAFGLVFFAHAQTATCANYYQSGIAIPAGYGAAYDILENMNQLMVSVDCGSGSPVVTVGMNVAREYIYSKGYVYQNSAWQQITLTGDSVNNSTGSPDWWKAWGKATLSGVNTSQWTYIVGYICTWNGSAWKCGCADTTCATGLWQLQAFMQQQASTGGGGGNGTLPVPRLEVFVQDPGLAVIQSQAPQYNVGVFLQAYGDASGNINIDTSADSNLANDVAAWKASTDKRGDHRIALVNVCDAFQGCQSGVYMNSTQAANATAGLENIVSTYGFNGIMWDLEGGEGTTWNKSTIDQIDANLKSRFGANFIIAQGPRPFELHAGSTKRAWMATMDYTDIQDYFDGGIPAFACSNIQGLEGGTDGNSEGLSQFVNGADGGVTVPASKISMINSPGGTGPQTSQVGCTPEQYATAYQNLSAQYPGLGGASVWQSDIDQGNGWSFAKTFGNLLGL